MTTVEAWGEGSARDDRLPVEIQVTGAAEGDELRNCLWRHGLPASLVKAAEGWSVEVRSPYEDTHRLLNDLLAALEAWLPEHGEGVRVRVGEDHYLVGH